MNCSGGDPVDNHTKWANDIRETQGVAPNYPIIGDTALKISKLYGMLSATAAGTSEGRTPADNQTVRNVFVIGPDKKVKLIIVYKWTNPLLASVTLQGTPRTRAGRRSRAVYHAGRV